MNGVVGVDNSLITAAHELKTPLVLMRQLALELENTNDDHRKAEIVRRMKLTAERSLRLADNLTKIARLEDAMFEMEPIQVSNLCQEVVDELLPLSNALNQKVVIASSRKPLVCVGNRELLRSLLLGLIDNALQYNDKNEQIYIKYGISGRKLVITIRDHGPVINLNEYRNLRQSLGREKMPISAHPLSSGLGLLIADKFIKAMSGELTMSRHHSGGMTFRAHLPISKQLSLMEMI